MSSVQRGDKPALTDLETGAEALETAAEELKKASLQIKAATDSESGVQLLAEEVRDVLARVRAEREKLLSEPSDS
jgi:hypothetical protein